MHHARTSTGRLRMKGVALAAVTALALTGCGDDDSPQDAGTEPTTPGESSSQTPPGNDGASVSPEDETAAVIAAGRTAESAVDGGRVMAIEFDDGEWEVDLADAEGVEHDVRVSADGAQVTRDPRRDNTDDDDRRENRDLFAAATLDHEQAVEVAAGEAAGERVTELQLDEEGGRVVWDVELAGGRELRIDASSGDVLG